MLASSPISHWGEAEGTGVFPMDVETSIDNLWPCPLALWIQGLLFGTAGTFSLIQIQADSALAEELYSADI